MPQMKNGLTKSLGTHLVIEDSLELPNIAADGISIPTATETLIALKMTTLERLPRPYSSKCVSKITNATIDGFYSSVFKYSAKSCNSFCYVLNTNNTCGCYNPEAAGGVPLHEYDRLSKIFRRCNPNNGADTQCLQKVATNFSPCGCNPECKDIIYKVI